MNPFNIPVDKSTIRKIKEYAVMALQLLGIVIIACIMLFLLWLFMWTCHDLGIKM